MKRFYLIILIMAILSVFNCSDSIIWDSFEEDGYVKEGENFDFDQIYIPKSGNWEIKIYYKDDVELMFTRARHRGDYARGIGDNIIDVEHNREQNYYIIPKKYWGLSYNYFYITYKNEDQWENNGFKAYYKVIGVMK